MIHRSLLLASALLVPPAAQACEGPGGAGALHAAAPDPGAAELAAFELTDLDGRTRTLADLVPGFARGRVTVLSFTEVGCPIASKLAPRLDALARSAGDGVSFLCVDASPQDSLADLARESAELERVLPVVKDPRQALARRLGARTTTEVFVFDGSGALAYRGAVDDQYTVGAALPEPRTRFLVNALSAVAAGRAPEPAETAAPGCVLTLLPEDEQPEPVTYSSHVASILQRRCQVCHREGEVGPFPLTGFEEARGRAKMIQYVVEEGLMPPWNADERFDGVFANERRLTDKEKETLLAWIEGGMPQGDPADEPPAPEWPVGWTIGEPDLVVTPEFDVYAGEPLPPEGYAVPREGVVDYQYFTVETDFPEDRWIRAMEVQPGAKDVVHHVLIAVREKYGDIDERSYLAVYVPGDTPSVYPDGYAKRLPAGATLVFQLHYTPNGKQRNDLSRLGIIFAEEEPLFEVVTDAVVEDEFRIPPGAEHFQVVARRRLNEDTGVVSLFPHMHRRGKDFKYVAHYPDGEQEELLFSHYDFNWQESYILPDPMLLPAGTVLECVGHFDNSENNPNNPDPTKTVRWGDQSFEEMFIGYFDKVVPLE